MSKPGLVSSCPVSEVLITGNVTSKPAHHSVLGPGKRDGECDWKTSGNSPSGLSRAFPSFIGGTKDRSALTFRAG